MAMLSGRKSLVFKPRNRSLSQFRAFTCFVLADRVIGLVEIEFLLLAIMRSVHAWSGSQLSASQFSHWLLHCFISSPLMCRPVVPTGRRRCNLGCLYVITWTSLLRFFSTDVSSQCFLLGTDIRYLGCLQVVIGNADLPWC